MGLQSYAPIVQDPGMQPMLVVAGRSLLKLHIKLTFEFCFGLFLLNLVGLIQTVYVQFAIFRIVRVHVMPCCQVSKGPGNGESPAPSSETAKLNESTAPPPPGGRMLLKNLTPSRFWAMVEPYCADITPEDVRYLEEQIKACEDIGEYMKIPSLGRHYAEKWAEEDLAAERDSKSCSPVHNH